MEQWSKLYSNRKPYYQLKKSPSQFFSGHSRFIKQSLEKESVAEKPYLESEYPQMHLNLPGFSFPSFKRDKFEWPVGTGGAFVVGDIDWALSTHIFGESECNWDIPRPPRCIEGAQIITITASYFWKVEFNFTARIVEDTTSGTILLMLPGEAAGAWDTQDFQLIFPESANGVVTVCGYAGGISLLSATFQTLAGLAVSLSISPTNGLRFVGPVPQDTGGYIIGEVPVVQLVYGAIGNSCGCVDLTSDCCGGISALSWDTVNSAETVARGNSVSIYVEEGLGPFTWSVAGTGFTLGTTWTAGRTNSLSADGAACGMAIITAAGQCGSVVGYVLCTSGNYYWHHKVQVCSTWVCGECNVNPADHTICYENNGLWKIDTAWGSGAGGGSCVPCGASGSDRCGNAGATWIACEDWYEWRC